MQSTDTVSYPSGEGDRVTDTVHMCAHALTWDDGNIHKASLK